MNQFYTSGEIIEHYQGFLCRKKIWKLRTNKNEEGRETIRDRLRKTELRSRKKENGTEGERWRNRKVCDRWRNRKVWDR
jgi:hypothetical protein